MVKRGHVAKLTALLGIFETKLSSCQFYTSPIMNNKILIKKVSGDTVFFDEQKLRDSLTRSVAGDEETIAVLRQVKSKLYKGIKTKDIYKIAFSLLSKKKQPAASRYKLKKAIFELGPTGFPFEKYIGELFRSQGFTITVGSVLQGHCVKHEVDIVAEKGEEYRMLECKFHHEQGQFCKVKNPLYIHSRFKDIEIVLKQQPSFEKKILSGGLVTNTRFSTDALQFGSCMNMFMLGWDYPNGNGLKHQIDQFRLYPITVLMTITNSEKKALLEKGIILCKNLSENESVLHELRFSETRIAKVLHEVAILAGPIV
jgi:hypothetical protein